MTKPGIVISDSDEKKLRALLRSAERQGSGEKQVIEKLEAALRGAVILRSPRIPGDIVTVNSCVCLLDKDTGEEEEVWLRFTCDNEPSDRSCPVMSELGLALLGSRSGDVIEWTLPSGKRRGEIKEIVYQPERLGNYAV
ncbi:MAG TPA: nucleoside diphosphate kinase regulator [Deltaproteobacteria bacterium]|nr:nucleoside diphosphate kinase regulator [Deltaproteobacteria bacterium]